MKSGNAISQKKSGSAGNAVLDFLQKLGKSMLLPVAVMPLCGILMGIGYLLCPASMQGGDVVGLAGKIGFFLVKSGSALLDNIAVLFVIGIGIGMSQDRDGVGGLAAIVSWFIVTTLLKSETVVHLIPSFADNPVRMMAFDKINNPFIGIICGILGSVCYNKFKDFKTVEWLNFFSGKRFVSIVCGLLSVILAAILLFVWPAIFSGIYSLGKFIAGMGTLGASIYAALNRLLIPFGLHHALNNVFWFDTIGLGDLTNFWAGKTSADVGWSLGMYMSGFFPCMMFGLPGAAFAITRCSDKKKRKKVMGILLSSALCSFICGVTEPFEFAFMFVSPLLYVIYSVLYGVFTYITLALGFRAGFSFSAGLLDLVFSSSLPAAQKTWLIIPLGIAAFIVFFLVFYVFIKITKKNPMEHIADEASDKNISSSEKYRIMAEKIFRGLGGRSNIVAVDNCITRLRMTLKDADNIDEKMIMSSGAQGIMHLGKTNLQIVIGLDVQFVADELSKLCNGAETEKSIALSPPCDGELVKMSDISDPVFSGGVLGPCFGIEPENGDITAPIDGEVIQVAETLHSVCISGDGAEILVHAGIDTVKLKGEGFECLVKEGEKVRKGQEILKMDLNKVKAAGCPVTVITVVTNADDFKETVLNDKDNLCLKLK